MILSFVVPAGNKKDEHVLTINTLRNMHHAVFAKRNAYWRDGFHAAALVKGSAMTWCDITVDHIKPTRRNIDVAACVPAAKAGIDGIVLAGVLPDDTPEYVRTLTFNAPVYQQGVEALVITLRGELG